MRPQLYLIRRRHNTTMKVCGRVGLKQLKTDYRVVVVTVLLFIKCGETAHALAFRN